MAPIDRGRKRSNRIIRLASGREAVAAAAVVKWKRACLFLGRSGLLGQPLLEITLQLLRLHLDNHLLDEIHILSAFPFLLGHARQGFAPHVFGRKPLDLVDQLRPPGATPGYRIDSIENCQVMKSWLPQGSLVDF